MIMTRETTARWDDRGITLVEVLVALAVIGVGLVSVAVLVPIGFLGLQEADRVSTATFLAEQALERARAVTWTDGPAIDCLGLSAGDTPPVPVDATCHGVTSTQFPDDSTGDPRYRRHVRITSCAMTVCAGMETPALRRIEVTVAYTPLTASGVSVRPKTIRLESLVAQK